jgi:hypothetical protein
MRARWLPWLSVAAVFVAIRLLLIAFAPLLFDFDSFKYLGAADALWQGKGFPSFFEWLPITGGPLHVVPGYAWLLEGTWWVARRPNLLWVGAAHALIVGLGLFLAGRIAARCAGERVGLLVFGVLALSPTIAWLERMVMPDGLAAPLALAATAAALAAPPRPGSGIRPHVGAAASGLVMGACLLMRTSSQVFLPIPILVALQAGSGRATRLLWVLLYGIAILPPLLPWMLHNQEVHGTFRLTASTGRNLYFSGLWSNTIDRRQRFRELGLMGEEPAHPSLERSRRKFRKLIEEGRMSIPEDEMAPSWSFQISDSTLRELLSEGLSFPEADAVMGEMALRAYAERDLATLVQQRGALLWELFVADPGLNWWRRMSLRERAREKAFLPSYETHIGEIAEQRYGHPFSLRVVREMERSSRSGDVAEKVFRGWVRLLTFDGGLLLAAFLLAAPLLLWLGEGRWIAIWSFAAPPLAFFAAYLVVGAPLYRYQAALHAFMLPTVVLGAVVVVRRLPGPILARFTRS